MFLKYFFEEFFQNKIKNLELTCLAGFVNWFISLNEHLKNTFFDELKIARPVFEKNRPGSDVESGDVHRKSFTSFIFQRNLRCL